MGRLIVLTRVKSRIPQTFVQFLHHVPLPLDLGHNKALQYGTTKHFSMAQQSTSVYSSHRRAAVVKTHHAEQSIGTTQLLELSGGVIYGKTDLSGQETEVGPAELDAASGVCHSNRDVMAEHGRSTRAATPPLRFKFRAAANVQQIRSDGQDVALFLSIRERDRLGDGRYFAPSPRCQRFWGQRQAVRFGGLTERTTRRPRSGF